MMTPVGEKQHGPVFRDLAPDDLGGDDRLAAAGRRNEQRTTSI
jgi:hypothetical protein